jgi:hypothetical protein
MRENNRFFVSLMPYYFPFPHFHLAKQSALCPVPFTVRFPAGQPQDTRKCTD